MSRTKSVVRAGGLPDKYLALMKRNPLTSIRSDSDLDAAQAVVDDLLRQELDAGKQVHLDALSDLVIVYEQEHHAVAPLSPDTSKNPARPGFRQWPIPPPAI
jgi:hypothetical protein